MYNNIGGKIKGLAIAAFIIEAIGAVIAAIAFLSFDDEYFILGTLTLIGGPFVAWASSWIIYAFGELVERTIDNEENTREILYTLKYSDSYTGAFSQGKTETPKSSASKAVNQCECGEMFYGPYCPVCGKRAATQSGQPKPAKSTSKSSRTCKCGERFYGDTCPNCGRNING